MIPRLRVLGVGEEHELGDLYARLQARGHDVRVYVSSAGSHDIMDGLIPRAPTLDAALHWVREAGDRGLVVFESACRGGLQDALRAEGLRVVGGSTLGDQLEQDRAFGQRSLREVGLCTLPTHAFDDFGAAIAWIKEARKRCVLKLNGACGTETRNYVGSRTDGADVIAMLQHLRGQWTHDHAPDFILMEHVVGIEMGVGAFFDGVRFGPPNLDWEHKRFFEGDLGELTGEMGTLVTFRNAERFFSQTLALLAPSLRAAGHIGYVNLNTIVNDEGVWPLELTSRFGYPGFAVLSALQRDPWDELLVRLVEQRIDGMETHPGYAVGVVITVPPFPYRDGYERLGKGLPILLDEDLTEAEHASLHFSEVRMNGEQLVTAGAIGYVGVVTGRGETAFEAQRAAYRLAAKVAIPNIRYRSDIAARFIAREEAALQTLGWLPQLQRAATLGAG